MNSDDITRRQFVATASAASVSAVGSSVFGARAALAGPPMVRKDVAGMTAASPAIVSYRKAVKAMKALTEKDPCSWTYQAAIHYTTITPALPTWNKCQHGTNLFWPWHRMYLYWFERIVRKMSGDATWMLPFWNWTSNPQLPPMFRDPTSDLYVSARNTSMNTGASLVPTTVSYSTAFTFTNFNLTDTSFEGTPHGAVHIGVGGWMKSVPTAAQDPIFFLHHCNVDRLWDLWLAQGGGRSDPLSDATWTGAKFTFFDENCKEVVMSTCDVLSAADQLGYKYEGEPPQVMQSCAMPSKASVVLAQLKLFEMPGTPVELGNDPVTVHFDVKETRDRLLSAAKTKAETPLLLLEGIEAESQPGVVWDVYVGAPAGAQLLGTSSPYYVGTLALFGAGVRDEATHHGFKPAQFVFPISRAVAASVKAQTEDLSVLFVPTGAVLEAKPSKPQVAAKVHIGKASIAIEQQ